jgi:penicillin amidase
VWFGQNPHIAWGHTSLQTDILDVFQDRLIRDAPGCPVRLCIESAGELHPVEERSESYRINQVGDGVLDNFFEFPPRPDVLTVPFRSFGPILDVEDRSVVDGGPATETTALTLQYTGLQGTRRLHWIFNTQRARDVFEFREGARFASELNTVVADNSGNLAYFSGGEVPLRADLEAGGLVGSHPALIRDGSGPNNWIPDPERSQGQVLPFQVIPFDEMPQVVNPPAGFVVNANEDPSGSVLDNDSLNQFRPSNPGAIYYFGSYFLTSGLRNGRVTRLLREKIDGGEKISLDDMKRFQANTQLLDAELMTPFVLAAFENAHSPGTPSELAAFASDPGIAEAMGRLAAWDFSTPTGIPEGYDASDVDGVRSPDVSPTEAAHSVAATLYNVWRAKFIRNQVNAPLAALGLAPGFGGSSLALVHHLLSQEPFTGVGASGVNFFPEPAALAPEDRRDVALLQALSDAIDALASNRYADAFGNSTNQDDYRWGRLHRVTFRHPLGGPFSIPPAAGFTDLTLDLPGISRDGGYNTVNRGVNSALADGANQFQCGQGAVSRLVMAPDHPLARPDGVLGFNSLPGGSSGDSEDPLYASQLGSWLTVDYHRMPMNARDVRVAAERVELFTPAVP